MELPSFATKQTMAISYASCIHCDYRACISSFWVRGWEYFNDHFKIYFLHRSTDAIQCWHYFQVCLLSFFFFFFCGVDVCGNLWSRCSTISKIKTSAINLNHGQKHLITSECGAPLLPLFFRNNRIDENKIKPHHQPKCSHCHFRNGFEPNVIFRMWKSISKLRIIAPCKKTMSHEWKWNMIMWQMVLQENTLTFR